MIRNDFVSNSSSSSFIVGHDMNKFHILLDSPTVFNLKDYLKHFCRREIFDYFEFNRGKENMNFVTPQKFSKMFATNVAQTLPNTAKNFYIEYDNISKNAPNCSKWDDPKYSSWSKKLDDLMGKIMDCVYDALEPQWKNFKFDYQEVDDNFLGDYYSDEDSDDPENSNKYNYENCDSMEDFLQEKIEYFEQLTGNKFKFKVRIFGNH